MNRQWLGMSLGLQAESKFAQGIHGRLQNTSFHLNKYRSTLQLAKKIFMKQKCFFQKPIELPRHQIKDEFKSNVTQQVKELTRCPWILFCCCSFQFGFELVGVVAQNHCGFGGCFKSCERYFFKNTLNLLEKKTHQDVLNRGRTMGAVYKSL